ncbi:MAG: adenylate/guanylate cyclase domain-containing protein, partial [Gemmatimonadota bacterium]
FWGAPIAVDDHARRAADAALDMLAELEALNGKWRAAGIDAAFDIGIGINTGEAVVGNIGSLSHKLDYTAIGDAVNLASRLEGLNKEHGTHVLVSETTRKALGEAYELRALDEVRVKGKERPVRIHELVGRTRPTEERPSRAGAIAVVAAALAAAGLWTGPAAAPLAAQETASDTIKARWVDWVYRPGRWDGARLVPFTTSNPATDTLAVTAKLDGYSLPPRWRVEVRRIEEGRTLGEPVVLVGEGGDVWVRSGLGVVPLAEHAAADDSLVLAILTRFDERGRPTARGPDRLVDRGADGRVRRVLFRQPLARTDFEASLLETGGGRVAGRNVLRLSMEAVGGARDEEVVASAGARGVARVRTIDGEIEVMPDTAAIVRMQSDGVGIVELDRFLREAGLGPYGGTRAEQEGEPREEEGAS